MRDPEVIQPSQDGGRPIPLEVSAGRRWAWLPVLLVGSALFITVQQVLAVTGNAHLVPSLLMLASLLIPVTFVFYVDGRNPAYDIPLSVLLVCALLGGVLGTAVASILEFDTLRHLGAVPNLAVGVIEEAAKLLVPLWVLLFTRYRANPADGLLLGVVVGMGFAVLETLGYGFVALLTTRGDLGTVEELLLIRGVMSPAGHAAWTGLAANALWHARARRWSTAALAGAAGTFVLVVILHTAWDASASSYGYVIVGLISLALLIRQTHRNVLTPVTSWPRAVPR